MSIWGPYTFDGRIARVVLRAIDRQPIGKLIARRKTYTLFEIPRPFPRTPRGKPKPHYAKRWDLRPPFIRLAGREWYLPNEITVWRKGDTLGVTVWFVHRLRMRLFDRCEGCGRRFAWRYAPVCTLEHEHRPHTKSVVWARTGLYHHGCGHDPAADYRSTQSWDRQWGHDIYLRQTVLNEPVDVAAELAALAQVRRDADRAYVQRLSDSRRERLAGDFAWKFPQEEQAS